MLVMVEEQGVGWNRAPKGKMVGVGSEADGWMLGLTKRILTGTSSHCKVMEIPEH